MKHEYIAGVCSDKDVDLLLVNTPLRDYSERAKTNDYTLPVLGGVYSYASGFRGV